MFIREISHGFRWNIGLIGDDSEFQGYFVIFLDIFFKNNAVEIHKMFIKCIFCTYIYVVRTVYMHSHYGYYKPFCRVDYVIPYA